MDGSSWYEIHDQSPVRNVKKRYCSFALSRSIECALSYPDTCMRGRSFANAKTLRVELCSNLQDFAQPVGKI
jgi:hypothetical protein